MILGIDYGSKLAGTTVIAYQLDGLVYLEKSVKNQDADEMIINFVSKVEVEVIGLDAPLSLPGVYTKPHQYDNYFYRACDSALKAMSPMFLGGLTARAIKLKNGMVARDIKMFEVYPAKVAQDLGLKMFGYKSKAPDYAQMISVLKDLGLVLARGSDIQTSHDLDAVLALYAALRIDTSKEKYAGDIDEGLIYY